jgi:Tfp pilus assembly protein PilF
VKEVPDSPTARLALGISLFETGEVSAAVVELEAAARLEPRMRQAHFHLARAYNTLGRPEDMERAVARFRELAREEQEANAALIGAPNPNE